MVLTYLMMNKINQELAKEKEDEDG